MVFFIVAALACIFKRLIGVCAELGRQLSADWEQQHLPSGCSYTLQYASQLDLVPLRNAYEHASMNLLCSNNKRCEMRTLLQIIKRHQDIEYTTMN
jgi:hypothetical protein